MDRLPRRLRHAARLICSPRLRAFEQFVQVVDRAGATPLRRSPWARFRELALGPLSGGRRSRMLKASGNAPGLSANRRRRPDRPQVRQLLAACPRPADAATTRVGRTRPPQCASRAMPLRFLVSEKARLTMPTSAEIPDAATPSDGNVRGFRCLFRTHGKSALKCVLCLMTPFWYGMIT